MHIACLSLFLSPSLSLSMQSPIDREMCRSCIMQIVQFLCFHSFMDWHSLSVSSSLSLSLSPSHVLTLSLTLSLSWSLSISMQCTIDREICSSHIMQIVQFLCFHHFTDGHSLSLLLSLSLSLSLSLYAISVPRVTASLPIHPWHPLHTLKPPDTPKQTPYTP